MVSSDMSAKGSFSSKHLNNVWKNGKKKKYALSLPPKKLTRIEPPPPPDPSTFLPVEVGNRIKVLFRFTNGGLWVDRYAKGTVKRVTPLTLFVHYDDGEKSWVNRSEPTIHII